MSATITSAQLVETVIPGLSGVTMKLFNSQKEFWKQMLNPRDSKLAAERMLSMAGFGSMPQKDKGAPISFDTFYEGYKTTATNLTYALAYSIEREAWEDAQYGVMGMLAKALGKSAYNSREVAAANLLNNGFSDSYTFGDSEPLFGDASTLTHPRKDGGTWTNQPSTAADLSNASLEQMYVDVAAVVDDRNMKEFHAPKKIIIPTTLQVLANALINSAKKATTNNNDDNFFEGKLQIVVNPFLTDTDAWFVLCEDHELTMQQRVPFGTEGDHDPYSGDLIHRGRQRFLATAYGARGTYGNPGA